MLFAVAGAFGDSGDLLTISASVNRKHDDNLFKRPSDGSLGAVAGDGSTTSRLDVSLHKQFSLQSVALTVGLTDNRYDSFKALNSVNDNYSMAWQWQFTPHLTGTLSATRSQAQSDFADFRGSGQNIRTAETRRFDENWRIMGGWSLGVGASHTKSMNSQTFQQEDSNEQRIADGNLSYSFASGSSITLLTSISRAEQQRALNPASLSDNRFRERRDDVKLNWPITGKTTVTGGIGQVRRMHNTFSVRDYAGLNGNARVSWAATAKTQFTLTRSRSTESWEEINSTHSIRDLFGLAALWTITPKLSLNANLAQTRRSFGGDIPGQPSNDRFDKTLTRSIGTDWAPYTKIKLGASISDERRDSTLVGTDYRSRAATINTNIEF